MGLLTKTATSKMHHKRIAVQWRLLCINFPELDHKKSGLRPLLLCMVALSVLTTRHSCYGQLATQGADHLALFKTLKPKKEIPSCSTFVSVHSSSLTLRMRAKEIIHIGPTRGIGRIFILPKNMVNVMCFTN